MIHLFSMVVVATGAATTIVIGAPDFDPVNGFKPAQRDLTAIYLQLAGSLEHYGSPIPYLCHVSGEIDRIAAEFKQKRGSDMTNYPRQLYRLTTSTA